MLPVIEYLRKNKKIYILYRASLMFIKRKVYGLENVSQTFFMSGLSSVSRDLVAGDYSFMARNCRICPKVKIGKYVMFGPGVTITGSDHRFDKVGVPIIFSGRPDLPETVIDSDVWIGDGSLIMAGVKIGRGSIIAARSVVTKDIPPYEIHGGVPARKIKNRFATNDETLAHSAMLDAATIRGNFCNRLETIDGL